MGFQAGTGPGLSLLQSQIWAEEGTSKPSRHKWAAEENRMLLFPPAIFMISPTETSPDTNII